MKLQTQQYDFSNKAIRCDTWEQMEHLAKLADEQGYKPALFMREHFFDASREYRHLCIEGGFYTNFSHEHLPDFTEAHYSTFIASSTPKK